MKRLAVAAATGAIFVVGYVLEWHVVEPARRTMATTFQSDALVWLTALGWLLMAGLVVGLAWLLSVWSAGDRVAACLVALIGFGAWAIVPLSYGSSTGTLMAFLPGNVLSAFTGQVGYVWATGAFVLAVGVAALVRARR